jgi:hypothetical protein
MDLKIDSHYRICPLCEACCPFSNAMAAMPWRPRSAIRVRTKSVCGAISRAL